MVTSRRTLAAAEGDAIGEQQLKRMQSGVVAEADAIGAQFGLTMRARLVIARDTTTQGASE